MRVTGVTISGEQLEFARERLQRAGLADRVDLQFRDYRDIEGRTTTSSRSRWSRRWASATGRTTSRRSSATWRRAARRCVQAIVIADECFEGYRRHPDFIQTYIFPGGMLLSPASLREQCRQAGLKIAELYSFGLDYAHTLEAWLGRFDTVADQVGQARFRRAFPPHVAILPRLLCRRLLDPAHGRFAGALPAYITGANQERPKTARTGRLTGESRTDRARHRRARQNPIQPSDRLFDPAIAARHGGAAGRAQCQPFLRRGAEAVAPDHGADLHLRPRRRCHPGSGDRPDQRPLHAPRPARATGLRRR